MARGGTTLGVAIGTGSIALPLASQGIRVDGIDISTAMVFRLRAKPGGTGISVTHTSRRQSGGLPGLQLTSQSRGFRGDYLAAYGPIAPEPRSEILGHIPSLVGLVDRCGESLVERPGAEMSE